MSYFFTKLKTTTAKAVGDYAFYKLSTDNSTESIIGTWVFNETLTTNGLANNTGYQTIAAYTNNGTSFYRMYITVGGGIINYLTYNPTDTSQASTTAYDGFNNSGWADDKYRTITFLEEPTIVAPAFYEWLKANAVKQEESIVGTWLLSTYITEPGQSAIEQEVSGYVVIQGVTHYFNRMTIWATDGTAITPIMYLFGGDVNIAYYSTGENGSIKMNNDPTNSHTYEELTLTEAEFIEARTFTITGYKCNVGYHDLINAWLKSNATRIEQESVVGTWTFNDKMSRAYDNSTFSARFQVDAYVEHDYYDKIEIANNGWITYHYWYTSSDSTMTSSYVAYQSTWVKPAAQTIRITSEPTDQNFISWLKANATKIA